MSHSNRVACYVIAFVLFLIAVVLEIVETRKVTSTMLIAAGLAVVDFVWWQDA